MYNINSVNYHYDTEKLTTKAVDRGVVIAIAISCFFYLIYLVKCCIRLRVTKDWRFVFPLIAALFAFSNNANDLYYIITAPLNKYRACDGIFLYTFMATASFNWTPISYVQVIRLHQFTKSYYTRKRHIFIMAVTLILSFAYTICYYLNLINFKGKRHRMFGCTVENNSNYTLFVPAFDIADSFFSLSIIVVSIYLAIKDLKHLKMHHQKMKAMLDESILQLLIIVISKIVIYTLIYNQRDNPGGDIFWDMLSVIVIFCSYRMVNLRPKLKEKMEFQNYNKREPKNLNLNNNWPSIVGGGDENNAMPAMYNEIYNKPVPPQTQASTPKFYNRDTNGELVFPSIMPQIKYNDMKLNNNRNTGYYDMGMANTTAVTAAAVAVTNGLNMNNGISIRGSGGGGLGSVGIEYGGNGVRNGMGGMNGFNGLNGMNTLNSNGMNGNNRKTGLSNLSTHTNEMI